MKIHGILHLTALSSRPPLEPSSDVIRSYFQSHLTNPPSFCPYLGGESCSIHCNFNYTKLPISLPEFYKECIVAWTLLNEDNPSSLSEIANQVIWNNRFICIEFKSIYNRVGWLMLELLKLEISTITLTCNSKF